jgi:hypothetical protein
MDPAAIVRRAKTKRRARQDIVSDHVKLYSELRKKDLQAVLIDAAVWLCLDTQTTHMFDCLCLGNLDGGPGMAAHVTAALKAGTKPVSGDRSVRLSLDEAFFLVHALGILKVHDIIDDVAVELDELTLWRRLRAIRRDFVVLYLAYHHFRSKVRADMLFATSIEGFSHLLMTFARLPSDSQRTNALQGWIPRTGVQYGVDFVIYQRHPALAHSDYSVVVTPVNGGRGDLARPGLSWHDLQVTNRLTTQVGKRLLLLNVLEHGEGDYDSPVCLLRFSVQERLIRRWVPER